jgi:hypothetical protein
VGSANIEAAEALGLLVDHLYVRDLGAAGAVAAELDHLLHPLRLPFEDRLNGAIGSVADPARYPNCLRSAPGGVSEEDTLHAPTDHDPPAGQSPYSSSSYSEAAVATVRPKTSEAVTGGDWTETQQRSAEP